MLIKNELGKIFGKKASWIYMLIIVIAVVLGKGYIQDRLGGESNNNWREETQATVNQCSRI